MTSLIDIPEIKVGDLVGFADWVELIGLLVEDGTISQAEIADVLLTSGLYGAEPRELFPGDEGAAEEGDLTSDDPAFRFVERIWNHLALRQDLLGEIYPFQVEFDILKRIPSTWSDVPSFTQVLLTAHTARYCKEVIVERLNSMSFRQLFEKVVQAAGHGLFGGPASRFGVPREPGWPTRVNERVERFAEELGLSVLRRDLAETPGDRTLDVAMRVEVGGDPSGALIFLTQCATGRHWEEKRGEPTLQEWRDVLMWKGMIVRSVAIPWWFNGSEEYDRYFRYFDEALVLDRRRLLAGRPDEYLANDVRDIILEWWEAQMARLPTLE